MKSNTYIFPSPEEVAKNFAEWLFLAIVGDDKQVVHIALSGGSTPKLLFEELAQNYSKKIPWGRVHFWWGDERCVAPDDIDSNYGVVKKLLFDRITLPDENIHRVRGEAQNLNQELERYTSDIEMNVESVNGLPCFDLILLGMGDDGHTASIFPHEMELMNTDGLCALATHPASGQKRVTLTGPVINNATTVVFLVTGENKKEKFYEIKEEKDSFETYPAYYIKPNHGTLLWFIDQEVVGK